MHLLQGGRRILPTGKAGFAGAAFRPSIAENN
jgi:hypothetical protein